MPFNIKSNGGPAGQLKIGGSVSVTAGNVAGPVQDGSQAHPFILPTNGMSLYKTFSATPGVTPGTFRGPNYYGIYFKFTMPTLTLGQSLRILGGIGRGDPYSVADVDSYMNLS